MNTIELLNLSKEKIAKLTKEKILEALEHKFTVTNNLNEKDKEKERHDKEMKEFRTLIETLSACLNIELPRDYYGKAVEWNKVSIPLVMGKMFAEIAKIEYSKTIIKED